MMYLGFIALTLSALCFAASLFGLTESQRTSSGQGCALFFIAGAICLK